MHRVLSAALVLPGLACSNLLVSDEDRARSEAYVREEATKREAEEREKAETERSATARLQKWTDELTVLHGRLPEVPKLQQPCTAPLTRGTLEVIDDGMIQAVAATNDGIIANRPSTGHAQLQSEAMRTAFHDAHFGGGHDWTLVAKAMDQLDRATRIAVFVVTSHTPPEVDKLSSSFIPGTMTADLAVFDRATKTPICRIQLTAENRGAVEVTTQLGEREYDEGDLASQLVAALAREIHAQGVAKLHELGATVSPTESSPS